MAWSYRILRDPSGSCIGGERVGTGVLIGGYYSGPGEGRWLLKPARKHLAVVRVDEFGACFGDRVNSIFGCLVGEIEELRMTSKH